MAEGSPYNDMYWLGHSKGCGQCLHYLTIMLLLEYSFLVISGEFLGEPLGLAL